MFSVFTRMVIYSEQKAASETYMSALQWKSFFFIIAIIRLRSHCKFFRFQRVRFFIFKLQEFSSGRRFMPSLAKQLLLADNYSAW